MLAHQSVVMGRLDDRVLMVLFEAPALDMLARAAQQWISEHDEYRSISFSHSREARWESRASLAGPAEVAVYTGVLLVEDRRT